MDKKSALKGKMLPLFLLAASCGMFNILYLCVIFYVPFQSAFGFTNEQMGALLGAYAIVGTPMIFFGGLFSDILNPKHLLVFACVACGACGFALATFPSFEVTRIIYIILAFPCSMNWGSYCKCVGMMGSNEEQGRLFGTANTIDGALTCILTLGLTTAFSSIIGTQAGFRWVILIMSGFYTLTGVGIALFYDYKKWAAANPQTKDSGSSKFSLKIIVDSLKQPITWCAAFMVMGSYMASSCLTYLSPYLNSVYVLPVALASAFGVITRYGVKIVAAPVGGNLRDRKLGGSTPKLVWTATAGMAVATALLMILPKGNSWVVVAVIVALLVIFCFRLNNSSESTVYYQLSSTPMHLMGTIVGLASVIGYSSDLWLPSLIGKILDTNGGAGYKYVFVIMIAAMCVASVGGAVLHKLYKKEQAEKAAA